MHSLNSHFKESGLFFQFIACLFAIYDTLYILCVTGWQCWCSSCSCPAVTTSVAESPSISSPSACLWVEAAPSRLKIKPVPHLLYFTAFRHVLTLQLSLSDTHFRRLWREWCWALWQCACSLSEDKSLQLMLTHFHNHNPIWSTC